MSIPVTVSGGSTPTTPDTTTHLDAPLSVQTAPLQRLPGVASTDSGTCQCHWDVASDQDLIEITAAKSRTQLGIIADLICGLDFSQWSGTASQTCQAQVQSACTLVTTLDDELIETRRLLTITGDISS